jgi:hypothetical protein
VKSDLDFLIDRLFLAEGFSVARPFLGSALAAGKTGVRQSNSSAKQNDLRRGSFLETQGIV